MSTKTPGEKIAAIVRDLVEEAFEAPELPRGLGVEIIALAEKPLISALLKRYAGNRSHAAAAIGWNRNTLRARMKAYGIR